jgi:GT2 family glycosyltransferase
MTIGVVVTSYNSWDIAIQCIDAHLAYAGHAIEKIILVDDFSTQTYNGVVDPRVKIVRNEKNLGYVKSVNIGFRQLETDIVMLFDADAAPFMDYSEIIIQAFERNVQLAVIGFTSFDRNHNITGSSENEPGSLSLILGQKLELYFQHLMKPNQSKLVVYSCNIAVRKKAFDSVGGFDENFDFLDADNDFCMSVRRSGWQVIHSEEVKSYHEGGGSFQLVSHRVLRFYKNRWLLLKKHGKIRSVIFTKSLILARLRMEYWFLILFGKVVFKDSLVLNDKLNGRKKIIEFCKESYH